MNRKVKQVVLPLLAALIWGSAFVVQKDSTDILGALSFNWTRSLAAALGLLLLVKILDRRALTQAQGEAGRGSRRELLTAGLIAGTMLTLGSTLQQYGIGFTTAGKAGFLTALYIVIVPLVGLFFRRRVRLTVWCGVAVACAGLYFLSFAAGGVPAFNKGDVLMVLCAFAFTGHILTIDHFTKRVDGIRLSCVQFFVAAAELFVAALFVEGLPWDAIRACLPHILYAGILSSGVGYTLQILAQKDGDPTVVSLLLSLESLFAVVSGAIFLGESLSAREYFGCALMLCAVVLVQLPEKKAPADLSQKG